MKFEEEKKRFYIDTKSVKYCYPRSVSRFVEDLGVLEEYKDKKYTLDEINQIIADLIIRQPYMKGSMSIKISISSNLGYHHILDFKNYWYDEQEPSNDKSIHFRN